jgi:23S rRNA G2445 N2-methylase RlmL
MINPYKILFRQPEKKRPLGILESRCSDNIKTDLKEILCKDLDWIYLAQDRVPWRALVNTVMDLRVS